MNGGADAGAGDREALEAVRAVVLKPSETLDEERFPRIAGYDFNSGADNLLGLLASMASTGFQASNLGDAVTVVNQMVSSPNLKKKTLAPCMLMCGSFIFYYRALNDLKLDWRLSHEKPGGDCDEEELDPAYRESVKCKIFLGFTSNLVSSGIRDIIRFLVQHRMVSDPPSSNFFVLSRRN